MNWSNTTRDNLKINVNYLDSFSKTIESWKTVRKDILQKYNCTCSCCGGIYKKFLTCYMNKKTNQLDISCYLCHTISHINYNFKNDIVLCVSQLTQLNIVRKTVEFIIKFKRIPSIIEIDPNAKLTELSFVDYSNLLIHANTKNINLSLEPDINFDKYKIFFNSNMYPTFIASLIITKSMFEEDEDEDDKVNTNEVINLPIIQQLTDVERSRFIEILDS